LYNTNASNFRLWIEQRGENDKMPGPSILDKKKTAVVIIGYQLNVLNLFPVEFQTALLSRADNVLNAARQNGMPVFFVQRREGTPELEIDSRLVRLPEEITLTMKKRSPFASTNLDERLKKLGINTIVLMGIHTSASVLTTVRWGTEIDYKFFIISDCCADLDADVQNFLFAKVFYHTATVIDSKAFFELLLKS
jgi:nicotinamidase-related amidase